MKWFNLFRKARNGNPDHQFLCAQGYHKYKIEAPE